jgi:hypothetical protein
MANSLMELYGGGMAGPSNNYQLGGRIASARRERDYQGEYRRLKQASERMAKRQRRASGLGSILSTVGSIAGSFIPIPGVGTAIGSAIGTAAGSALGRLVGESTYKDTKVGGGKYAQKSRKDLRGYSEDFKRSRAERALVGGLKAGAMKFATAGGADYLKAKFDPNFAKLPQADIAKLEQIEGGIGFETPRAEALFDTSSIAAQDKGALWALKDRADAFVDQSSYTPFEDMLLSDIPATQLGDFSNIGLPPQYPSDAYYGPYLPNRRGGGLIPMMPMGGYVNPQRPNIPMMPQPYQPMAGTGLQGQTTGEGVVPTTGGTQDLTPGPLSDSAISALEGFQVFGSDNPVFGADTDWSGLQIAGMPPSPKQKPTGSGGTFDPSAGYGTATGTMGALQQMGMGDVASDPRLQKYLEDLPQFSMGYEQKVGDYRTGAQQGLLGLSQSGASGAGGFAGSGAATTQAQKQREQMIGQFGRQQRGVVEDYQADVLAGIQDIERKGEFEFGVDIPEETATNPNPPPDSAALYEGHTVTQNGIKWQWNGMNWENMGPG